MPFKSFEDRLESVCHPKVKKLINIILQKESNLCVSADVMTSKELINLVHAVGPFVCMIKTHIDIISDFTIDLVKELKSLSIKYNFLIFEDRKFADLGNTVQKQFGEGIYKINSWADFINAHVIVGPGIVDGLRNVSQGQALIIIAQMSAAGNLCNSFYTKEAVKIAESNKDFVCGFICTESVTDNDSFINFVPGVNLSSEGDKLGQQYVSPECAIRKGADIVIVGRGIYSSQDMAIAAKEYRDKSFHAYNGLIDNIDRAYKAKP